MPFGKMERLVRPFAGAPVQRADAPWEDPLEYFANIRRGAGDLALAGNGAGRGRYSFVGVDPLFTLRMAGERGEFFSAGGRSEFRGAPPEIIKKADDVFSAARQGEVPFFDGGLFWLFAYELNRFYEPSAKAHAPEEDDFWCAFYPRVRVFDHAERKAFDVWRGDSAPPPVSGRPLGNWRLGAFVCDEGRKDYEAKIADIQGRIVRGDVLQVNLSRRLAAPFSGDAVALFSEMSRRNPAPFGVFADGGDFQVLSLSPELFFTVEGGTIETSPIKGTAPRRADPASDRAEMGRLAASEKNRAENLMIVDLMRNDLSRICVSGGVSVPSLFSGETLPAVHHLVSTVRGRLKEGVRLPEILGAVWPGGSVTGAPKVKAMEIISEMETSPRGFYCGSAVAQGFGGYLTASLMIRTLCIRGGSAVWRTGGGIVADSVPEEEFEETEHKAAVLRGLS